MKLNHAVNLLRQMRLMLLTLMFKQRCPFMHEGVFCESGYGTVGFFPQARFPLSTKSNKRCLTCMLLQREQKSLAVPQISIPKIKPWRKCFLGARTKEILLSSEARPFYLPTQRPVPFKIVNPFY